MIQPRPGAERGHFNHGWLDTYHSFSFADYYDPEHTQFSVLRVINEDRVAPGAGFPMHGHRDMEIITYLLEGRLAHRDSLGNGSIIETGDVQRMTAGRGVRHSEFNPSQDQPTHLLQIWILPDRNGLDPGYEQKRIVPQDKHNRWCLIAAPDGGAGVHIHQDARLYCASLDRDASLDHRMQEGRKAYVQVARGTIALNDVSLSEGDGARVDGERALTMRATRDSELLLFDLP